MFSIMVSEVVFAQSAKYLIIAKNDIETKRSEVCTDWTSAPTFRQPILVDSLDHLIIKACIATTQRKLSVIGSFSISSQSLSNSHQIYCSSRDFQNIIQDKEVCVGRCKITITKTSVQDPNKTNKQLLEDDDLQFKSNQSNEDENDLRKQGKRCQLKFIIHCGFDFYLNQGFSVHVKWGALKKCTKLVYNKISPFWGEYILMDGNEDKQLELQVKDSKGNKLQWIKIQPKHIRITFPYHLQIKFREQCVGVFPSVFVTILREDVPLFSILDRQIRLDIKYVGPNMTNRRHEYLLIYRRQVEESESRLPVFLPLDMKQYISFENINKLIETSEIVDYQWNHWNLLLPMKSDNAVINKQQITLLKSMFSKSLVCLFFSLEDLKLLFQKYLWNGVTVIDRRENFEKSLKDIYYNEKKVILGKTIELSNVQIQDIENEENAISDEQKWRILSQNYILRKRMLDNSIKTTSQFKQKIKQKGQYLKQLKKTLLEVRKMNAVMIEKQKSAFVPKIDKKIRDNYQNYHLVDITAALFQKHQELEQRKRVNDQMRMRMNSLQHFNEDTEQLDKVLVSNAEKLHKQQDALKQMNLVRKALPKQRQVIAKLEKIFEKREVDRQMNELLKKEDEKLKMIHRGKRQNLQNVYKIVKQHNSSSNSLKHAIQSAEKELIALNLEYVKLIN